MTKVISESKITKVCPICDEAFVSYKCQNRQVCSKECRHKSHSQKLRTIEERECLTCHKVFKPRSSKGKFCGLECSNNYTKTPCLVCGKLILKKLKTCSRECMAIRYKELLKGENNPNWKGGFFSRENSLVSARLRTEVLKRDNYKCQECGAIDWEEKPSLLHTHHIIEFKDDGETELSNLITLCFVCHWEGKHGYTLGRDMQEIASRQGCGNHRREIN